MFDESNPPPRLVRDCLFAFEVLRRIGFSPEEIYVGTGTVFDVGRAAIVTLKTSGPEWVWVIGPLDRAEAEFHELFTQAANAWNALTPRTDPWGYERSRIRRLAVAAVSSMVCKGISIPRRYSPPAVASS